jgi:hypothetical protein
VVGASGGFEGVFGASGRIAGVVEGFARAVKLLKDLQELSSCLKGFRAVLDSLTAAD